MLASGGSRSRDRAHYFRMTGGMSPFSPARSARSLPVVALALLALLSTGVAHATPAELLGVGPKGVALAGSGTSLDLGPGAALANPAGLANQSEKELTFGYRATRFALSIESGASELSYPADLSSGLEFGVAAPLSQGFIQSGVGLMVATPPNFVVRAEVPFDGTPWFPLIAGRAQALDFGAGFGLRVGPVSAGAGLRALAALSGSVAVAGGTSSAGGVGTRLVPAWAPSLGLRLDLESIGRVGASFRGVLRADFDADVAAPRLGPITLAPLNVVGVAAYEPLRVELEFSRTMGPLEVVLGARYEHWAGFDGWVGPTIACPPGRPSCGTPPPASPNYSDVFTPRLGATYRFDISPVMLDLRAGYTFVPSPVPEQVGVKNEFDAARHGFGLGYSLSLPDDLVPLHLDAAFRLDLLVPRTHHKAGAPAVSTSGSAQTVVFGVGVEL